MKSEALDEFCSALAFELARKIPILMALYQAAERSQHAVRIQAPDIERRCPGNRQELGRHRYAQALAQVLRGVGCEIVIELPPCKLLQGGLDGAERRLNRVRPLFERATDRGIGERMASGR
jgi:hypothetical protein